MINLKKMDDEDFVFLSMPLSEKEEKDFSNFLKQRKTKLRLPKVAKKQKEIAEQ
jgi:hypothetical protein